MLVDDAKEYWERGVRVSEGDLMQLQNAVNYRGPLYPTFLGICRWCFGRDALFAVILLQHSMHVATGLIVAAMTWVICRNRILVFFAYGMSVLSVTGPWYSNVVLTESFFQLIMTATFGALVIYHLRPTALGAGLLGLFLGMAILTRPIPKLLWIPLFLLFFAHSYNLFTRRRKNFRRIAVQVAVACMAMFCVMAPWSIRNWFVFQNAAVAKVPSINKWVVCFHDRSAADLPIPITESGYQLRRYLPEIDLDSSLRRDGYEVIRRLQRAGLSDTQIDELVNTICLEAIYNNPRVFFWKTFKRFVNFWRCPVNPYPYYSKYSSDREVDFDKQMIWRFEPIASWYEWILQRSPSLQLRWMELDSIAGFLGTALLIVRKKTRIIGLSLATIFLYFAAVTASLEVESYRYRLVLDPCIQVAIVCGLFGGQIRLRSDKIARTTVKGSRNGHRHSL